jgi:hypothetical protein
MIAPFDIFWVGPDGGLIWRAVADSMDAAKQRIDLLAKSQPGEYVVMSLRTGNKISIRVGGDAKPVTR